MQLPRQLARAIVIETARCDPRSLTTATSELSHRYRSENSAESRFLFTPAHRYAYLAARMPATFAAAHAVFTTARQLMPSECVSTLLDLGAGPGTAGWAALSVFDWVKEMTLVEQDEDWIQIGRSLADSGECTALEDADWTHADLRGDRTFNLHDLVVCSYVLSEMEEIAARGVLNAAWAATGRAIVIIEPGTMRGFNRIRRLRDDLIALGGHVVAPCPHHDVCPVTANDWCHFSQRVERSPRHRRMKSGLLGYEDEKFSYVVASKHPVERAVARVIRHPLRRSGHAHIPLCTREGLETITVARSDKENWRRARKVAWGDSWEWRRQ